jgi:hypothetical protein
MGMKQCVTLESAKLPSSGGEVNFTFYPAGGSGVINMHLGSVEVSQMTVQEAVEAMVASTPEKAIPEELRFSLLCRVRLAKEYATLASRRAALVMRLQALTILVHCSADTQTLLAYFQQVPEISQELVNLIRHPPGTRDSGSLEASPDTGVPIAVFLAATLLITYLAVEKPNPSGLGAYGRHIQLLPALGVVRGQHHGILVSLMRCAVSKFMHICSRMKEAAAAPSANKSRGIEDLDDISMGLTFVEATGNQHGDGDSSGVVDMPGAVNMVEVIGQLEWIENVLILIGEGAPFYSRCMCKSGTVLFCSIGCPVFTHRV